MRFIALIGGVVFVLGLFILITQILLPLLNRTPIFPYWRKNELRDKVDARREEVAVLKEEVASLEELVEIETVHKQLTEKLNAKSE